MRRAANTICSLQTVNIQGFAFFNGKIDEVKIGNRDPGADWIKLCYMNQKETDALVTVK